MKILPKTLLLSPLFCFSKKRLFEEIAETASQELSIPQEKLIKSLDNREKLGSTILFDGIALPHAAINSEENKSCAILSILNKPISFNSIDATPQHIDIAFAFFISKDQKYSDVEMMLKKLSQILSSSDLLNAMRLARNEINKLNQIINKIDDMLSKEDPKPDTEEQGIDEKSIEE